MRITESTSIKHVRLGVVKGYPQYRRAYPADVKPYLGHELTKAIESYDDGELCQERDRLNLEYARRIESARVNAGGKIHRRAGVKMHRG